MQNIRIRRITLFDPEYGQVLALREAVLRQPLGLSLKDEDLSAEADEYTLIAEEEGRVIGCVMLRPLSPESLKLRQMAVADSHQRQGIGAALVREAEAFAAEKGFALMTLHARMNAVPFYEQGGYVTFGEPFTEVGIPHHFMQKRLR